MPHEFWEYLAFLVGTGSSPGFVWAGAFLILSDDCFSIWGIFLANSLVSTLPKTCGWPHPVLRRVPSWQFSSLWCFVLWALAAFAPHTISLFSSMQAVSLPFSRLEIPSNSTGTAGSSDNRITILVPHFGGTNLSLPVFHIEKYCLILFVQTEV